MARWIGWDRRKRLPNWARPRAGVSYELLRAVSPLDEETLQHGLKQLVEAELVYQRGLPRRPTISSSMRSFRTRPISRCSRARGSSITSRLPRCWRSGSRRPTRLSPSCWRITTPRQVYRAGYSLLAASGQRASQRSANVEAICHLTKGLELLKTLPDTPSVPNKNSPCKSPWARLNGHQGVCGPGGGKGLHPGRELCRQVGKPSALPGAVGINGVLSGAGGVPDGT